MFGMLASRRMVLSHLSSLRRAISFGSVAAFHSSENDEFEHENTPKIAMENQGSRPPFKRIMSLAHSARANEAFGEYRRWLEDNEETIDPVNGKYRSDNAAALSVLLVSLESAMKRMSVEEFFETSGGGETWLQNRLGEVERLIRQYDVVLPWRAFRSLVDIEMTLYRLKRQWSDHASAARCSLEQCALIDALIGRVVELEQTVMSQHGKETPDLYGDGDERLCSSLMNLMEARGDGLAAIVQCYETQLAQSNDEFASAKLNATLVRLTRVEMTKLIGRWSARDKSATLRAKMPASLIADLRRVLAAVSTMRVMDPKTMMWALSMAQALHEAESIALVLDALVHHIGASDFSIAHMMLKLCLHFAPPNSVDVVDQLWALYRTSPNLSPSLGDVMCSMKVYRQAGAIGKLIDVYENAIGELNIALDARHVAVLMHSVIDKRTCSAGTEQQLRALKLAQQSGYIDHEYVSCQVARLPESVLAGASELEWPTE
jgi:hypothetical protein